MILSSAATAAGEGEVAAVAEDDRRRRRREEVDEREVEAVQDDGLVVRRPVAAVHVPEARVARALPREGLDDPHPGDVLLERRRPRAEALPHPAVGARRETSEDRRRDRHEREYGEGGEREPPVEDGEDCGGADEDQR